VLKDQNNFLGCTSPTLNQTVYRAVTSVRVTASPGVISSGDNLTLTATLNSKPNSASGSVTFTDGTSLLGHAAINDHSAILHTRRITGSGVHVITATYPGSKNFGASSGTVDVTVQ